MSNRGAQVAGDDQDGQRRQQRYLGRTGPAPPAQQPGRRAGCGARVSKDVFTSWFKHMRPEGVRISAKAVQPNKVKTDRVRGGVGGRRGLRKSVLWGTFWLVLHRINDNGLLLPKPNVSTKGKVMKCALHSKLIRSTGITSAGRILLGLILVAGTATSVHAQGQIASGMVSGSGNGPYTYSLTFSDAANSLSPVGSVWYAWVPGSFYLPGVPTSASAPPGWTATISGHSVQFVANSPANDITAGSSLSGFSYQAAFSPAQLAAAANSGVSVAYSGGLFSDAGYTFTVQLATVPEPSMFALLICGATGLCLVGRRWLRAG